MGQTEPIFIEGYGQLSEGYLQISGSVWSVEIVQRGVSWKMLARIWRGTPKRRRF